MAFNQSLTEPSPSARESGGRALMPDADACVDELLALAEWLRDHRGDRETGDFGKEAAA